MNWHSIGRYLEKFVNNAIVIDFGSTTTDFICIKNGEIVNKAFNDFTRLLNGEIVNSDVIRKTVLTRSNFRSDEDWQNVQKAVIERDSISNWA